MNGKNIRHMAAIKPQERCMNTVDGAYSRQAKKNVTTKQKLMHITFLRLLGLRRWDLRSKEHAASDPDENRIITPARTYLLLSNSRPCKPHMQQVVTKKRHIGLCSQSMIQSNGASCSGKIVLSILSNSQKKERSLCIMLPLQQSETSW
mmetsp:Transcript_152184/g.268701  ORF Transcript_152184/g.268701 Transcript_152184/m.268701 type:complete len:149 (+) Transcript_152184:455-901(+)